MRKLIPFAILILIAGACTFYDVEPRYDNRNKFVGYYDVEEYSNTYNDITYYEIRISKSRYDREIYIDNFYGADLRVYAIVSFDDIRIPFQVVDGYEIEGTGTLEHRDLILDYRVLDLYSNTMADYCETVAWK